MVEFTERHEKLLEETNKTVIAIKTALVGINGEGGLIERVDTLNNNHNSLEEKHNKLEKRVWLIVGILAGSGALGSGIYALIQAI